MKKLIYLLLACITLPASAAIFDTPARGGEPDALMYRWMTGAKTPDLIVWSSPTAENFISTDELERYFKIRLRSFMRDYKFANGEELFTPIMSLQLTLSKYNDNSSIHYGMLDFKYSPGPAFGDAFSEPLRVTYPIANNGPNLNSTVKEAVDLIVERYVEAEFSIGETVEKHKDFLKDADAFAKSLAE